MNWIAGHELAKERTREHLREATRIHSIELARAGRRPRPRPSLADLWRRMSPPNPLRPHPRGGDA